MSDMCSEHREEIDPACSTCRRSGSIAKQLVGLSWGETSGVQNPANDEPGFAIRKDKGDQMSNDYSVPDRILEILSKMAPEDSEVLTGFLTLVGTELGKRDTTIAKSLMERIGESLAKSAADEEFGAMKKAMINMLADALTGDMPAADPEIESMRVTVAKAVLNVTGGSRVRKGAPGTYDIVGKVLDALDDSMTEEIPDKRTMVGLDNPSRGRRFLKAG